MAGVDKGPDGSKSGCFGICQGVLTMVDVVMTLSSGQVLALTRIMPDFAVRGRSEQSPRARLVAVEIRRCATKKNQNEHLPLLHTTLPYHSEIIKEKFMSPSSSGPPAPARPV